MNWYATLLVAVLSLTSADVRAQSSLDWRIVGWTSEEYVFYEATGVKQLANGNREVWMKALPVKATHKAMDTVLSDESRNKRIQAKIASGHLPLVRLRQKLSPEQLTNMLVYEEVANSSEVQPTMRLLEEIDCRNGLSRQLSAIMDKGGKSGTSNKVGEWEQIAPETNLSIVQMSVCPKG